MSGRFSKVHGRALWRSKRFLGLSDSDAKLLLFYFMTSEHQTSAGAYAIPDGYAVADLGWELKRYHKARAQLVEAELIAFDEETDTVYVERWFKHNPAQNIKHAIGIRRQIEELESEVIAAKVQTDFDATDTRCLADMHPSEGPSPVPMSETLRNKLSR